MTAAAEHRVVNPWIVAIAVMFATFMEVLDTTVVNVSLPHIAGNLSATIDESTWVLTSYLVANAIVLPLTGWLARHFGRKRLLMTSVTGFTVSSLLCGLAPNLPMLVAFRLLQGATGGAMQPISQAVLLEAFPPHERGKAMGFWGLGIVVAPILGPVLGGWLTDTYSWRWVFYINLPVGIASLVMTKLYVFDPAYLRKETNRIDYWGIGLLGLWVGSLQLALDLGQERDWFSSLFITTLVVLAVGGLIAFLVREWVAREPVVDLRVFKVGTYSTGVFLMTTLGFVMYGSLVLLPIMLQTLLGYPSLQAGIAMAPRGLGSLIGMPMVGLMIGRIDPRKMVAGGLIAGAGTLFWLAQLNLEAGYWDIFWPQFFQGLGLAQTAGIHQHHGGACHPLFAGGAERARIRAGRIYRIRLGCIHGHPTRIRRRVRCGSASGLDGGLRRRVPPARHHLFVALAARTVDAPSARTRAGGRRLTMMHSAVNAASISA